MFDQLLIELVLVIVGIAGTYFLKQLGDTKRVQKFAENNAVIFSFVQSAVRAVEQKSKTMAFEEGEKYNLVFDRTKSFVNNSLSKYNLDNQKVTDEYIDTLIERAVKELKEL